MRPARLRLRALVVLAVTAMVTMACGVNGDSSLRPIDPAEIPDELVATTSTTVAPSTTAAATTTSTTLPELATTTTVPVESVVVFFVAGAQVVPIDRLLLSPAAAPQVLAALLEGVPEGDLAAGLRSALPSELAATVLVERGIASVDLPGAFVTDLPGAEQRLAVAQIVLTLTRRAGIGQVVFTSDNQPLPVPRGRGDLTAPGDPVACDDYSNLLAAGYSC